MPLGVDLAFLGVEPRVIDGKGWDQPDWLRTTFSVLLCLCPPSCRCLAGDLTPALAGELVCSSPATHLAGLAGNFLLLLLRKDLRGLSAA
jgi:hypothetical protein